MILNQGFIILCFPREIYVYYEMQCMLCGRLTQFFGDYGSSEYVFCDPSMFVTYVFIVLLRLHVIVVLNLFNDLLDHLTN